MIWTSYDPEADAFYARFAPEGMEVTETREVAPGVRVDLDTAGQMLGIEVLSVRLRGAGAYGAGSGAESSSLPASARGKVGFR